MTTEVLTPEVVKSEALSIPEKAKAISVIRSHDEYAQAGSLLVTIKGLRKKIAETFGPIVAAAFQAHKTAKAKQSEVEAPLDFAERHLKGLMVAYDDEQERIRQQAQRAAEEAARKAEEDRRLQQAADIEAAGDAAGAVASLDEPVAPPPVVVEKTTPKVAGLSYRDNWTFSIVDADKVPREYLMIDEVKIRAVVRALKADTNIPGIKAYAEKVLAGRA